jgi:hypothetical protein
MMLRMILCILSTWRVSQFFSAWYFVWFSVFWPYGATYDSLHFVHMVLSVILCILSTRYFAWFSAFCPHGASYDSLHFVHVVLRMILYILATWCFIWFSAFCPQDASYDSLHFVHMVLRMLFSIRSDSFIYCALHKSIYSYIDIESVIWSKSWWNYMQ